jgi:hypothetical protein
VSIRTFSLPGWDDYSTWGEEEGLGHLYAQLYANHDDPDGPPRVWITPPGFVVRTVDELSEAISTQIRPHLPMNLPAEVVKMYLLG